MSDRCRCGWDGKGEHPCHRCGSKTGTLRYYPPTMRFSLSGAQFKLSVRETFGCDMCWAGFMKMWNEKNSELAERMTRTGLPVAEVKNKSSAWKAVVGWKRGST